MTKLAQIAKRVVNQTGIYHSQKPYYWQTLDLNSSDMDVKKRFQGKESINGCKQVRFFIREICGLLIYLALHLRA